MVSNDVEHHPDISSMTSLDQRMELISRAEVLIDLLPVECSISMVVRFGVVGYWRNPYCIKSHSLNVIEMVSYAIESSTTILG